LMPDRSASSANYLWELAAGPHFLASLQILPSVRV
jgi:hypothetical protein